MLGVGATQFVACFTPLIVGLGPSYSGPVARSGLADTTPDWVLTASHATVPDPNEMKIARFSDREQHCLPASPTGVSRSRSPARATQNAVHYSTNDDHLHPIEGTFTAASEPFFDHAVNSSAVILPLVGNSSSNTRGNDASSDVVNTIDCNSGTYHRSGWLPGAPPKGSSLSLALSRLAMALLHRCYHPALHRPLATPTGALHQAGCLEPPSKGSSLVC